MKDQVTMSAETLFPYFKSIGFAVFNCSEYDKRKGREAVIREYGPKGWREVRARTKTGIMEIFHHTPTRETRLYAVTVGQSADARAMRRQVKAVLTP